MRLVHLFRNSSIRSKLSLLAMINGSIGLLLVGALLVVYERVELNRAAASDLTIQAAVVADSAKAALIFQDDKAAGETLAALRQDPDLVEAAIYDGENHLFALWEREAKSPYVVPLANPKPTGAWFEGGNLLASQPIRMGGKAIGSVYIRQDLASTEAQRRRYMGFVGFVLLASFVIALILNSRLQGAITQPLAELSQLARYVSAEKDYSVRAKRQSGDEIGILVDSFNEMLSQIGLRDEALRESEQRFALAAKGANDGLWDWKLSTGQMYMSPRGNQMFGFPEIENSWTLNDWAENIHPSDRDRVAEEWADCFRSERKEFISEYRMRHVNGASIWVLSRGKAVRNGEGKVVRVAGSITDITKGKIADALTGLHSRFYFLDRLEGALEDSENSFAVLFLDLDRFKLVNDSLGHAAGDELLVEIARRLRFGVNDARGNMDHSVVARLGGDEFAVLLMNAGKKEASEIAQRFVHDLSEPFRLGTRQMFPGVSIGIALSGSGNKPADLLRNADTAMYNAKQAGRGRFEIFDEEMRNRVMARMEIEADLRTAISEKQLVVFYQPQVLVDGGRVHGFEALVRWQHPERGLVPPNDFIPIAEETDLILSLGRWVLEEACTQMAQWLEEFHPDPPLSISVNVSYKQLKEPGFIDDVKRILEETGLPAERLRLEMTESTAMNDAEETIDALTRLKAMGVGLEIDDFGTGYSSLSCLKRLPFDTIKIDRSFVRELGGSDEATEIVRAIVDLAGSMTMSVVAEGVETAAQLHELNALGCAFAQGYLFSKPVTARVAGELVENEMFRRDLQQLDLGVRGGVSTQVLLQIPSLHGVYEI